MSELNEGYPQPIPLEPNQVLGKVKDAIFQFYGGYGDMRVSDLKLSEPFPDWLGEQLTIYETTQGESLDNLISTLPGAIPDREHVEMAAELPEDTEEHIKLATLLTLIREPVLFDPAEEVRATALDTDLFVRVIQETLAKREYPPNSRDISALNHIQDADPDHMPTEISIYYLNTQQYGENPDLPPKIPCWALLKPGKSHSDNPNNYYIVTDPNDNTDITNFLIDHDPALLRKMHADVIAADERTRYLTLGEKVFFPAANENYVAIQNEVAAINGEVRDAFANHLYAVLEAAPNHSGYLFSPMSIISEANPISPDAAAGELPYEKVLKVFLDPRDHNVIHVTWSDLASHKAPQTEEFYGEVLVPAPRHAAMRLNRYGLEYAGVDHHGNIAWDRGYDDPDAKALLFEIHEHLSVTTPEAFKKLAHGDRASFRDSLAPLTQAKDLPSYLNALQRIGIASLGIAKSPTLFVYSETSVLPTMFPNLPEEEDKIYIGTSKN